MENSGIMSLFQSKKALLVLENGVVFTGRSFGSEKTCLGEVCFNTSMSGYQEILTDPSYKKQIVCLTYPMIGNYGTSDDENESDGIQASGLIVKEYVNTPSAFHSQNTLGDFLKDQNIPGIEGLDTRKLVLMIRNQGAMRGGIFCSESYSPYMLDEVLNIPEMSGQNLASVVTTKTRYSYGTHNNSKFKLAVLDFGIKTNILKLLDNAGFAVEVFPASTSYEMLKQEKFDCYFLSNGPGDPEPLDFAQDTIKSILHEKKPVFGICLGHQLIGLARGLKSFKLKFGHRGGNQPVLNHSNGKVEITSQNHGFAILDQKSSDLNISHINLNDSTIEGFTDSDGLVMSVQYHPEASPGPHDSEYLFNEFYNMVQNHYI